MMHLKCTLNFPIGLKPTRPQLRTVSFGIQKIFSGQYLDRTLVSCVHYQREGAGAKTGGKNGYFLPENGPEENISAQVEILNFLTTVEEENNNRTTLFMTTI